MRIRIIYFLTLLFTTSLAADAATPEWEATGSLTQGRLRHTATLLLDGRVLVAGGDLANGVSTAGSELYDPATGIWEAAGGLTTARRRHTATLLPGGKVLVVGGLGASGTLASAELYDPATGIWSPTAGMVGARYDHTATLLRSGLVLVAGGGNDTVNAVTTAELYNPASATWTDAAGLKDPRRLFTATQLASGEVLAAGGLNAGGGRQRSCEVYDWTLDAWRKVGDLAIERISHTATLLPHDGRVLVVGGTGGASGDPLAGAELYDPADGAWEVAPPPAVARERHNATLLPSGKLLVAGGLNDDGSVVASELYDPASPGWTPAGDAVTARHSATATLLRSGRVLLAGGRNTGVVNPLSQAELYDAAAGRWGASGFLATGRAVHSAALLPDGRVLVAGGRDADSIETVTAELYDPATGIWTGTANLEPARTIAATVLLPDGQVLVVGGRSGNAGLASVELYDPQTELWSTTGPLEDPRRDHRAVLLASGEVLAIGGKSDSTTLLAGAEIYDPVAETWRPTGALNAGRSSFTATLLLSGEVLVAGGESGSAVLRGAELYDPATGTWTPTGDLQVGRSNHSATLLPSGEVLVAGGETGSDFLASAELYDPATGTWEPAPPLLAARSNHRALLLRSGRVLVAGGGAAGDFPTAVELYDRAAGTWRATGELATGREFASLTLLLSGEVLFAGGRPGDLAPALAGTEIYAPDVYPAGRPPEITGYPATLSYEADPGAVTGHLRGDSEASEGDTASSPTNVPLLRLLSVEGGRSAALLPDPERTQSFGDDPMTLELGELPAGLFPGRYLLTVTSSGVPGTSEMVELVCSLAIDQQPQDATVAIGGSATFTVGSRGGRTFRWQQCVGDDIACPDLGDPEAEAGWLDIPGASGASYTTPQVTGPESGTKVRVVVDNECKSRTSDVAVLSVDEAVPPTADVISPDGGEFWLLSEAGEPPSTELVTWAASDNVRVCRVEVRLLFSTDGGESFERAASGGGLPETFGEGGACPHPGVETASLVYSVPLEPPAGTTAAVYKIEVEVTDHGDLVTSADSENHFFIVRDDPGNVKTLILANVARMADPEVMGISPADAAVLTANLRQLADHPRVQGRVVDLAAVTSLGALYAAWDAEPENPDLANQVLFAPGGLQEHLQEELLPIFTGVENLVLVGDDRIVPMARIPDRTVLLPETEYPAGGDLSADGTTVGQALAAGAYLTDDPLAVLDRVLPEALGSGFFIPDLAVGRLVEEPQEIVTTIATYISQDGILDLTQLDPDSGHKVLVTGYDFLLDSGRKIRARWKGALGQPLDDDALAPVDGQLLTPDWGLGSVAARIDALFTHLDGHGAQRYAIASLNGHATHYQEGVPGVDRFDIRGLDAVDVHGGPDACGNLGSGPLDLAGSVIYAVGCHGGLPVAGSCATDADHSLDLPQTFLARGATAYIANSGYGWGLLNGVGYGERLVEIFSEQLSSGGNLTVGEAVLDAKVRYYLETPYFDPYDEKTLMQWTFFGLPMFRVVTGIDPEGEAANLFAGPPRQLGELPAEESFGAVRVTHRVATPPAAPPPDHLTVLRQGFDFSAAAGVYRKFDASGEEVPPGVVGCPAPDPGEPEGCYYTLNGLSTGQADVPIQPHFIFDSRLSGTSQHGVLWLGGAYDEESDWLAILGQLASNDDGAGSDHGVSPQHIRNKPATEPLVRGEDPPDCRASDLELNGLVVPAGEALKAEAGDLTFTIERIYREVDLEVFYFNNQTDPAENCDRQGPMLEAPLSGGEYHEVVGTVLEWTVPASDPGGVWRVVAVTTDNILDAEGRGSWVPLELVETVLADGTVAWQGSRDFAGAERITYSLQAVDRKGNVTWLDFDSAELRRRGAAGDPASGVPLDVPAAVFVELGALGEADLVLAVADSPDPVATLGVLTYTLAVSNLGPDPASDLEVTVELPTEVTPGTAVGAGWSCGGEGALVTCTRASLGVGNAPLLTLGVTAPAAPGLLTASATVAAAQSDPDPVSNLATAQTAVVDPADGPLLRVADSPIGTAAGEAVDVVVEILGAADSDVSSVAFSIDYDQTCLAFDASDGDGDGMPDAIDLRLPGGFVAGGGFNPDDLDGEIDLLIADFSPPLAVLPDGVLLVLTLHTTCAPPAGITLLAPVGFSSDPSPSFGDTTGQDVLGGAVGGVVEIHPGLRGDCNDSGFVRAADIPALALEIYDGDGDFWLDVPAGSFAGSPVGCDSNADTTVDAGDVSCTGRLIFDVACGGGSGSSPEGTAPVGRPRLSVPANLPAVGGERVIVPLRLAPGGHALGSLVFSLDFDESRLAFDDTDADGDGVPEAVTFHGLEGRALGVSFDSADTGGELDFFLTDLRPEPQAFAGGLLVEVELVLLEPAEAVRDAVAFSQDPPASFGSLDGESVAGVAEVVLFGDGFETGDTGAWSQAH